MEQQKQSQVQRQWELIRILSETSDGVLLKTLAERLDTTPRTINRDLATLQQAGVPLKERTEAHGLKRWLLSEHNPAQESAFAYDEAAALYLGRRFLAPLMQTFLWDAADSALKKIRTQLGSQAIRHLDRLLNVFRTSKTEENRYADKSDLLDALILGCEEQREVVITYHSLSSKTYETYPIRPYDLEIGNDTVYIGGFSCKSYAPRLWKLDRMSSALVTDVKFEKPDEFLNMKFVTPNATPQKILICFDATVARYVQEHRWHESEKITKRPDGTLLVEYELSETLYLKSRLLSFGRHVKVLEPKSLRDDIRNEIQAALNQYEK